MRRPLTALLLLGSLLLPAAVSAEKVWFNPDKDEAALRQDRYDCESRAAKFSYDMGKAGKDKVVAGHFAECMEAQGYKLVPEKEARREAPRAAAPRLGAVRAPEAPACGGSRPRALTFVNSSTETVWLAEFGNGYSSNCKKDADCGGTNTCVNGWCTGIWCTKDSMCGDKGTTFCQTKTVCSKTLDNVCPAISCMKNSDCPFQPASGDACLGSTACKDNTTCPAIKCSANADCPDWTDKNNKPQKGSCSLGSAPNKLCAMTCEASTAQCLCANGSPCPAGGTCVNNRCTGGKGYCAVTCDVPSGRCACKKDGLACPESARCMDDGMCEKGGLCRYKTYPTAGERQPWEMAPGSTTVICVPDAWGGRLWPRTGCKVVDGGLKCETGDCNGKYSCEVSGDAPSTLFEANYDSTDSNLYYDISLVDAFNLPLKAESNSPACPALGGSGDLRGPACPKKLQMLADDQKTVLGCLSPCAVCNLRKDMTRKEFVNNPLLKTGVDCSPAKTGLYCCLNADGSAMPSCNMGNPVCFDDNDCGLTCDESKNDKDGKNADCGGNTCTGGFCQSMTCDDDHFCSPRTKLCKDDKACNTGEGFFCDLKNKDDDGNGFCRPNDARTKACCGPVNPAWQSAVKEYAAVFKKAMPTAYSYQYDDPSSLIICPKAPGVDFKITIGPKK